MGREDGGVGLRFSGRSNLVVPEKDTVRGRAPPEGDGGDDSAEAVAVRRGIIGVNQSSLPEKKVMLKSIDISNFSSFQKPAEGCHACYSNALYVVLFPSPVLCYVTHSLCDAED